MKKKSAILLTAFIALSVIIYGCSKQEENKSTTAKNEHVTKTTEAKTNETSKVPEPEGIKHVASPASTVIEWEGSKVTGKHNGIVKLKSGDVYVDDGKISGGTIEIDFTTIEVTDIKDAEMNSKLKGHLKSNDFFAVDTHPVGTFEITSSEPTTDKNGNNMLIRGNLKIRGIEKPISFPAKVTISNGKVDATAELKIDRTEYDMKFRSGKFFSDLGDNLINDEFIIKLKLSAESKSS